MENIEIIVLTVIISTLFIIFILGPVFYAHKLQANNGDVYRPQSSQPQINQKVAENKTTHSTHTPIAEASAVTPVSNVDFNENSDQNLQDLLSTLLKNPNLSTNSKLELSLAVSVAIQEMETNGIQFPVALKNSLIESINTKNPS